MTLKSIDIEGMRLLAPDAYPYTATNFTCACGAPATVYVHGANIDEDVCQACFKREYDQPSDGLESSGAWEADPIAPIDNRPLLAQCAALLARCADLTSSLLGGPIATHGLIDEIRSVQEEIGRVRAELAKAGW